MSSSRALYQMVRADFLERVRRYSFLLTIGLSVYFGYAVYSGQVTLQLDKYRGVDNSAWLGSVIGGVGSVWLSLIGFYIVKNAIQRDRETRVGQILAATPISKSFYTLGKALSNFAVLAVMVLVLACAALSIQLFSTAERHIDFVALLAPLLIFGLSALAITAALAVLFESLPVLRGGVGNVCYFFLWAAFLAVGIGALVQSGSRYAGNPFTDYTGIYLELGKMQAQVSSLDPLYNGNASFTLGGLNPTTKTFLWTGLHWTPELLLSRGFLLVVAVLLAQLGALFFDRFDSGRAGLRLPKKKRSTTALAESEPNAGDSSMARRTVASLTTFSSNAVRPAFRPRFSALAGAELQLMMKGRAWWWYAVAAGLFIACLASPLTAVRSGVLPAAWLWPVLIWSQMGTREAQFSTAGLIFSAPRPMPRQILALYAAGVMVAVLTGGGLALRLMIAGDLAGMAAWAAGALFIPAMALALGVISTSRKPFEAIYTALWYVGPMHHIPSLDPMGTTLQSSNPLLWLTAAAVLVLVAYAWRRTRLAHA